MNKDLDNVLDAIGTHMFIGGEFLSNNCKVEYFKFNEAFNKYNDVVLKIYRFFDSKFISFEWVNDTETFTFYSEISVYEIKSELKERLIELRG